MRSHVVLKQRPPLAAGNPHRLSVALWTAVVGGSLLTAVHHGEALAQGGLSPLRLLQIVATYVILYGLSSWVLGRHSHGAGRQ